MKIGTWVGVLAVTVSANHSGWGQDADLTEVERHMRRTPTEALIQRFESPERDAWQKPDAVLDRLGPLTGVTVADIGAGSGYFTFRLAERGARVIAVDINEEMLRHLRERASREDPTGRVEVRETAPDDPGLKPGEADIVLMVNTYHHVADRVAYLRRVQEGLAPGGRVVILEYFKRQLPVGPPPDHKLEEAVAVQEFRDAGFTAVAVDEDLLPYQYVLEASAPPREGDRP